MISDLDRRRIVELAYGRVGEHEDQRCRPKEIALDLGLRYCAVAKVLRLYRLAGGQLPEKRPRKPSARVPRISAELAAHLLEPETLKAWRGWSIARRVHQV